MSVILVLVLCIHDRVHFFFNINKLEHDTLRFGSQSLDSSQACLFMCYLF